MKKRMRSVELGRKRGGQPGNANAAKSGLHTAAAKSRRAGLARVLADTRALTDDLDTIALARRIAWKMP